MHKTNTNSTTKSKLIALLVAWPAVAVLLVYLLTFPVGFLVWAAGAGHYSNSLDRNFLITAIAVAAAHVLAFVAVPAYAVARAASPLTGRQIVALLATGTAVALIQLCMRMMSDIGARIDCGDACVDTVIPAGPGTVLTTATAVALTVALTTILYLGGRSRGRS